MARPKRLTDLIEEAIDKGATTVEEIHKAIADLPLKILEEIEFLKKPLRQVEKVQDRSIGAIYELIRAINEKVAKMARDMLKERRAPAPGRKPAAAPTRSSRTSR